MIERCLEKRESGREVLKREREICKREGGLEKREICKRDRGSKREREREIEV